MINYEEKIRELQEIPLSTRHYSIISSKMKLLVPSIFSTKLHSRYFSLRNIFYISFIRYFMRQCFVHLKHGLELSYSIAKELISNISLIWNAFEAMYLLSKVRRPVKCSTIYLFIYLFVCLFIYLFTFCHIAYACINICLGKKE